MCSSLIRAIVLVGIMLSIPGTSANMTPYEELMILFGRAGVQVIPEGQISGGYSEELPKKRTFGETYVCLEDIHKTMRASYDNSCSRMVVMQGQCVEESGSDDVPLMFTGNLSMKAVEILDEAKVLFSCEDQGTSSCYSAIVGDQFPDQLSSLLADPGCRTSMSCGNSFQMPTMLLSIVDTACSQ